MVRDCFLLLVQICGIQQNLIVQSAQQYGIKNNINKILKKPSKSYTCLSIIIQMKRLQQLIEKQLNKPRNYSQLKENPFPYLQDCNRLEIFQFIFEMEAENKKLAEHVREKYPDKTFEQFMREHAALQAKGRLIDINKETISKMDIQINDKMDQLQKLRERNIELQKQSRILAVNFEQAQSEFIQIQKQRRILEMKLKMQEQRQQKNIDLSQILSNLYIQVKQTLNKSL